MARTNAGNARTGRTAPEVPAPLVITDDTVITRDLLTADGFDALALHKIVSGKFVRGSLYVDSIVTEAAYSTYAMERDGYLYGDDTKAGWMTGTQYANSYALRSAGNVSLWRTLGYVLVAVGMDETAPEFLTLKKGIPSDLKKFIRRNADHKGDGQAPAIPTASEVIAEMKKYFDENGKKIARRQGPPSEVTNPGAGTDTGQEGAEVPTVEATPWQSVQLALASLDAHVKSITDDEWETVAERLAEIVTREATIREGQKAQTESA